MRISTLINRFFYKLHHISEFPKGNLPGCLMNMASRGFQPKRAIDVGANKGKWSRDLRAEFPDCECVLIEPQIEMKGYLDKFCQRNPGCTWVCAGAGENEGRLPFTIRPDMVSSSFVISEQKAKAEGFSRRMVPVMTLDGICEQYWNGAPPDVVKIDAEGFESQILRGAKTLLGKTEVFFLETHFFGDQTATSGVVSLTTAMGYHGYVPYDFTWFGKRPYDGAIGLCEIAYVRQTGVLRSFQGWSSASVDAA